MALARSNSLSLNTGAANMFSSQQQNLSQPQQSGGLFGAPTSTQPVGGLFSSSANNTPQPTGGLFGQSNAGSNLFGATTANNANATVQPQQNSGGLFGNSGPSNTASTGGGLFGAAQQPQPQQGGSLFGGAQAPSGGGGLFGNAAQSQPQNNQSGGLFGKVAQSQPQNSQPGGLFGNAAQSQPQNNQSSGLFGGGFGQNQPSSQNTGGIFGAQNKPAGTSLFGASITAQPQSSSRQPTLLGTSIFNNAPAASGPLAGSLTMGQGQAQQQTVPGTKIDLSNLRPTTRFSDLHDDLKKTLENIDNFIKQQEAYAAQCEALMPTHAQNVASLTPDVELITHKVDTVELGLENDSRTIQAAKSLLKTDATDLARCIRVLENQQLPTQFHYGQMRQQDDYDTDLVGYFSRQAQAMRDTLESFTGNLSEIEGHLRVVEADTMQQSASLSARRANGFRAGAKSHDAVRELADTLRGFEAGILQTAGSVGACREGLNELVLGRVGDGGRRGGVAKWH